MFKDLIVKEIFSNTKKEEYSSVSWIFDFRKVSLTSEFLEKFSELFFKEISKNFPELKKFQVCGLESSAISLLASIVVNAQKYGYEVNGFFIRKGRKKSDLHKIIEGKIENEPVIILDDVLNSGKSIFKQIEILENLENPKLKILSIFSIIRFRNLNFYDFILNKNIKIINLFELNDFQKELNLQNISTDSQSQIKPLNYEIIWKTKKSNKPFLKEILQKSHILINENKIYYATDDGIFFCANKENGETIWYKKILFGSNGKFIFSSPIIFDNKFFFGAYDGNFYCLDKNTGETIWVYRDADWIGSSPTISSKHKLVFIGLEYGLWKKAGGIVALNILTGKVIWKDLHEGMTHCSPFINSKQKLLFCGSNDKILRIYNPKTGEKIQEIKCDGEIKMSFSENKKQNKIVFGDFSGKIYILNEKTLEIVDCFETLEAIYSTPFWKDDCIIATSLDKKIYKYNTESKKVIWNFQTNGRIFFDPIYKDDFVWTGSNDGRLYKINFNTGLCEGYLQFLERVINNIIFDENNIYLNTFLNEVYCVKLLN